MDVDTVIPCVLTRDQVTERVLRLSQIDAALATLRAEYQSISAELAGAAFTVSETAVVVLTPTEQAVLAVLERHAGHSLTTTQFSAAELCLEHPEASTHKHSIRKALTRLCELGLSVRHGRRSGWEITHAGSERAAKLL